MDKADTNLIVVDERHGDKFGSVQQLRKRA